MNKLRWAKFFWSDWSDDPALAACSLAAQGLWMRLMCIAAQGTPYGHVTIAGKPPSMTTLQKLIRPKPKLETMVRLIKELERNGVCQSESDGTLVSRRMESDWKIASVRAGAAKSMWNKKKGPNLHMQKVNGDGHFALHESEAEAESPLKPPRKSRRQKQARGGGFASLAKGMRH